MSLIRLGGALFFTAYILQIHISQVSIKYYVRYSSESKDNLNNTH